MYTDFYKLKALPFQLTPDPRFFYASKVHNSAMAHLTYGLSQGEGFIIVTGEVGAGKTTLVGHLLSSLDPERYVAAKIVTTQLGADDMLRMVCSAFGIETEKSTKATLLQRFERFLHQNHSAGRRAVLLIDEAQNITVPALEELRMLSNLIVGNQPPLQCFLLGQPQFRAIIASPDLDQLRQRVIASYHLGPLSLAETRSYIEHRLELAGWQRDPDLSADVFERVHSHTGGVPRMINVLCSRLLLYAYLEEKHSINGDDVDAVADEYSRETEQMRGDASAAEESPATVGPPQVAEPASVVATEAAPKAVAPVEAPVPARRNGRLDPVPADEYGAGDVDFYEDQFDDIHHRLDSLETVVLRLERDVRKMLRLQREILEGFDDGRATAEIGDDIAAPRPSQRRRRRKAQRRQSGGREDRQRDDG